MHPHIEYILVITCKTWSRDDGPYTANTIRWCSSQDFYPWFLKHLLKSFQSCPLSVQV